jgi:hypothetical protein
MGWSLLNSEKPSVPPCGELMDRSAERCSSCRLDSRVVLLLRARFDGLEQRLAALEIAFGVGARGVNSGTSPAELKSHARGQGRRPRRPAVAMLLLVHSALLIISGELNSRSERRRPVA